MGCTVKSLETLDLEYVWFRIERPNKITLVLIKIF